MSLTDFLLMWRPITSPRSKSLSSPDLPILLVLLINEQHSFLPPFILVSAVIVTSRLQFTTTEGCPATFDQIVYMFMLDKGDSDNGNLISNMRFKVFILMRF
jgi:hypothetical protein